MSGKKKLKQLHSYFGVTLMLGQIDWNIIGKKQKQQEYKNNKLLIRKMSSNTYLP